VEFLLWLLIARLRVVGKITAICADRNWHYKYDGPMVAVCGQFMIVVS